MPALNASTDFAPSVRPGRRHTARGIVLTLLVLLLLATLLMATVWSFWALATGALGTLGAVVAAVALVAGAAVHSRYTERNFTGSLILVGCLGLILFIGALFSVAGYALVFGG